MLTEEHNIGFARVRPERLEQGRLAGARRAHDEQHLAGERIAADLIQNFLGLALLAIACP